MEYILSLDQGTTSSRAIIFDHSGSLVAQSQREHQQIFPQPGWVEHDPEEIWRNSCDVSAHVFRQSGVPKSAIKAIGITNQRETTVLWERESGKPLCNALVWQDTRTHKIIENLARAGGTDRFREKTGLPLSPYFSASKIIWILQNIPHAREKAQAGEILFGTIDSWILWNLTGGTAGGVHYTEVTNASRTMLMNIHTLEWDQQILETLDIPPAILPDIKSSSEFYGTVRDDHPLSGIPITGILGDQQAATFGQAAFDAGEAKNTYGTGNFIIVNTGTEIVQSKNGLLTTVGYQIGNDPPHYALEGSIAVTGSLIQWLRDNLGIIDSAAEIEELASQVNDNGGAYFVPAFSGLFAPYWRSNARGALVGLTRYVNKSHLARAALEATVFQTKEVIDAINADSGLPLHELKVDGGMIANTLLMQFQADMLGVPVVRPKVAETTALGAAYAAGLAINFWSSNTELRRNWKEGARWVPTMSENERDRLYRNWKKAVTKTFDWVDDDVQ